MSDQYTQPDKDKIEQIFSNAVSRRLITPASKELVISNLDMTFVPQVMGGALPSTFSGVPLLQLLLLDETGSVRFYRDKVIRLLRDMFVPALIKLQNKQAVDILLAVAGFNERPHLIVPFTRVDLIDTGLFEREYHPSGRTALYDAHSAAVTGLLGYGYTLYGDNVRGSRRNYGLITDGEENESEKNPDGSYVHPPREVAAFMADTRKERVNAYGMIGLGDSSTFTHEAKTMGFLVPQNLLTIEGATDTALAKALGLILRSSELISAQMSTGVVTPATAAASGDNMFFDVNATPADPLANI